MRKLVGTAVWKTGSKLAEYRWFPIRTAAHIIDLGFAIAGSAR